MERLIQEVQKTIVALEKLSESPKTASDQIDELLDQLFQQKIDLVGATRNESTASYQRALQAMGQAAAKAERAMKAPERIPEMAAAVSDAIAKVARVLDNVVPIE